MVFPNTSTSTHAAIARSPKALFLPVCEFSFRRPTPRKSSHRADNERNKEPACTLSLARRLPQNMKERKAALAAISNNDLIVELANDPEPRQLGLLIIVFQHHASLRHGDEREIAARDGAQKPKDMTMNRQVMKRAAVIAIAGAVALSAVTPSWAAPVSSSTTSVKAAAPSALSDVRYYRGYRGGHYRNNGAGVALGILGIAGAVAGAAAYGAYGDPGYYRQDYYGGGPYYGYRGGPPNYGYDNRY